MGGTRQSSYNMMNPDYNATAGSRMSGNLLGQASRANSQYLPEFSSGSPLIGGEGGGPTDFELELATQKILGTADLNSITKREVRRQLEQQYGIDLTSRKAVINAAIDRHLNGA